MSAGVVQVACYWLMQPGKWTHPTQKSILGIYQRRLLRNYVRIVLLDVCIVSPVAQMTS